MEKKFLFLFNFLIIAGFVGLSYFFFLLRPAAEGASLKKITITPGQGLTEITAVLRESNVIRSKKAAEIYALVFGLAHRLKPGNYFLDSGLSAPKILKILADGPQDIAAVINEGMSLRDIDEVLGAKGILPAGALANFNFIDLKKDYEFLNSAKGLEGYLFPDTYRFLPESDRALVIRKILDNFERKAWPLLKKCQASSARCQELTAVQMLV